MFTEVMEQLSDCQARTWVEHVNAAFAASGRQAVLAFPKGHLDEFGFKYYNPAQLQVLALQAGSLYAEQGLRPRQKGEEPLVVALYGFGTIDWAVGPPCILH